MAQQLPVLAVLPEIKEIFRSSANAVLTAPPGSGKTTRVPLALLDEPWLRGRRIVMLQPRRLAARMVARYMASLLGRRVGETVGYRVRLDSRVGPQTRIELVTEGVLIRMLQSDPALGDVGLVIFDEFHERSLYADLGLAMCLQAQSVLRGDLRLLVMSATLEAGPVAELLGGVPVIAAQGRSYPVETFYRDRPVEGAVEPAVAAAVLDALQACHGDLLVFLPGEGEIRRVKARLDEPCRAAGVSVLPLYGNLPPPAQEAAIAPSGAGGRKVVLATSIAETSLTVEGVTVVIDSGLARMPRFSPRTALTRLETVRVSRAGADQRRGRAGRLRPGRCYRLWTEREDGYLQPCGVPEILEADLAALALELALWGVRDPAELSWLDRPPAAALDQARALLARLGAIGRDGVATAHGRLMGEAGIHPRLAHMIIRAKALGLGAVACEAAALLNGRDILRGNGGASSADLRLRVAALRQAGDGDSGVEQAGLRQVRAEAAHLKRAFAVAGGERGDIDACGLLLALAYPDRIARRRDNGRFLLVNGRGAEVAAGQELADAAYLAVAELDDGGADSRIFLAAPLSEKDILSQFGDQLEETGVVAWDGGAGAVRARRLTRLGAITLKDAPWPEPEPRQVAAALIAGIREEGLAVLPWTEPARQFCRRIMFMRHIGLTWPDVSEEALRLSLEDWLGPFIQGLSRREDLQRLNLQAVLEALFSWPERLELDEWAPSHIIVPSGRRVAVDYSDPASPVLAARLQELFGLPETPRIAHGRVPLTLHLLSPAQRPVQVTRDLAGFWRTAYFEVRKDLRGRYPKHYWPDDPLAAEPTGRVRPRRS